ncbi:MAG: hypothetical protein ACLSD5_05095 [Eggerthella lenta]
MAIDKVKAFARAGMEDACWFRAPSATVELAAQAVGCEPARIAKTLSFHGDRVALVVAAEMRASTTPSTRRGSVARRRCSPPTRPSR